MNRSANGNIGATAAEVFCHCIVDLRIAWLRIAFQKCGSGHDLAGLAIAALRDRMLDPGTLHRMAAIFRKTFDRGDFSADSRGDIDAAGFGRLPIDMYGAVTTLRDSASVFRAGQAYIFSDNPQ